MILAAAPLVRIASTGGTRAGMIAEERRVAPIVTFALYFVYRTKEASENARDHRQFVGDNAPFSCKSP